MGFTNFPPIDATKSLNTYDWFTQFLKSLDEMASAESNSIHPPSTKLWDGNALGTLEIVDSHLVLTDTSKNWAVFNDGQWKKRYAPGWNNLDIDPDRQPGFYDVVLLDLYGDPWNWRKMQQTFIVDQNLIDNGDGSFSSNKLICSPIDTVNYPLGNFKHYFIVRSGGGWLNRVPRWPNDFTEEWAKPIASTTTSITVSKHTRNWSQDQWKGYYVYFALSGSGYIRSALITGNDRNGSNDNVLHFAAQSAAPDFTQVIGILDSSGAYWRPDHQLDVPDQETNASTNVVPMTAWIRMGEAQNDEFFTHTPEDEIRTMGFPNPAFTVGDFIDAGDNLVVDVINPDERAFIRGIDVDLITADQSTKDPTDHSFSLQYHSTFRSWYCRMASGVKNFVPYDSGAYEGTNRFWINNLSIPRWQWDAGVCAAHGTTGELIMDGDTVVGIEVTLATTEAIPSGFLPMTGRMTMEKVTHWECVTPEGGGDCVWTSSTEKWNKGANIFNDSEAVWDGINTLTVTTDGPFDVTHQFQEVWFSWYPQRAVRDRFRYFYDKEIFLPDSDPDTEDDVAAVPPKEDAPGTWLKRPKSGKNLLDFDDYGKAADPFSGTEYGGAQAITGTTIAIYEGDNFDHPTLQAAAEPRPWEVEYYDRAYEGKPLHPPQGPRNRDLQDFTITVVDDKLQFGDEQAHWWEGILIGGDGESTHSGDLVSFSSTSIHDSSHAGSAFWDGSRGRWVGHWFMIWQPDMGEGPGPLHQLLRPITSYSAGSLTFSFPEIQNLTQHYGNSRQTQYRIIEPKWEKNKWAQATCELKRQSGGAILHGTILYSSNNRLRIDGWKDNNNNPVTYTPVVGDTGNIKRASTGTAWRWNGTTWETPTGTDSRTGAKFPEGQWKIPPTHHLMYGRMMNGDLITKKYLDNMLALRRQLRMKKFNICFTPDSDGTSVSDNNKSWTISHPTGCAIACFPFSDSVSSFSGNTCNPTAMSTGESACTIGYTRSCGYAQLDLEKGCVETFSAANQRQRIDSDAHFLVWGEVALDGGGPVGDDIPDDGEDNGLEDWTFDANGDPVLYRQWHIFDSVGGHSIHRTSSQFGDLGRPNDAEQPCPGDGYLFHFNGYTVRQAIAIIDYGSGMTFL